MNKKKPPQKKHVALSGAKTEPILVPEMSRKKVLIKTEIVILHDECGQVYNKLIRGIFCMVSILHVEPHRFQAFIVRYICIETRHDQREQMSVLRDQTKKIFY